MVFLNQTDLQENVHRCEKQLVLLKTSPMLAAITQPQMFKNGWFIFVSNSGSLTTSGQWEIFFPHPVLLGVCPGFQIEIKELSPAVGNTYHLDVL